ncbi:hypothetical protein GUJ93_ZPchr0006g43881 [Zizania palustris]|uniref:Uncharacterized protein n=1 Tax=Zizania palustris TaxID=103762 RepID=A0A8J5SNE1_ZIZPA|nr:hypothetical protein GUJ93_ZPchr0006g43881 [Zizania palustris]
MEMDPLLAVVDILLAYQAILICETPPQVLHRLEKTCTQFTELWRRKQETGQWIEVEYEAMSSRSEFPPFNASGIMFMGDNMRQNLKTLSVSNGDVNGEDTAKADQRTTQHSGAPKSYMIFEIWLHVRYDVLF